MKKLQWGANAKTSHPLVSYAQGADYLGGHKFSTFPLGAILSMLKKILPLP